MSRMKLLSLTILARLSSGDIYTERDGASPGHKASQPWHDGDDKIRTTRTLLIGTRLFFSENMQNIFHHILMQFTYFWEAARILNGPVVAHNMLENVTTLKTVRNEQNMNPRHNNQGRELSLSLNILNIYNLLWAWCQADMSILK